MTIRTIVALKSSTGNNKGSNFNYLGGKSLLPPRFQRDGIWTVESNLSHAYFIFWWRIFTATGLHPRFLSFSFHRISILFHADWFYWIRVLKCGTSFIVQSIKLAMTNVYNENLWVSKFFCKLQPDRFNFSTKIKIDLYGLLLLFHIIPWYSGLSKLAIKYKTAK